MLLSEADEELKMVFIEEELSKFGEELCDLLAEEIEKKRLVETGDLLDSINYDSFKDGDNPGERIEFLTYGRFVDISAYKKIHEVNTNRVVWGLRENRKRKKKWYAKNMYSGLNRLMGHIMYGLTDQEIKRIKGILQNRNKA